MKTVEYFRQMEQTHYQEWHPAHKICQDYCRDLYLQDIISTATRMGRSSGLCRLGGIDKDHDVRSSYNNEAEEVDDQYTGGVCALWIMWSD